jgi:hypothetical protein
MIILQLKSSSNEKALSDISSIIFSIKEKWDYRIRGHEIHQVLKSVAPTMRERANSVSSFCSRNEIDYITYHSLSPRNQGLSLFDERSSEKANNSLLATLMEAELVQKEFGLKNKVLIVYHLPSVISLEEIRHLDKEKKYRILVHSENILLKFIKDNGAYFDSFATITVENVFPKYYTSGIEYATINMCHPLELVRLSKSGIGITFDLSHYKIYSNYLSHGEGNKIIDLDRQIYGPSAPSWDECIDLFGDSLKQLHINDGKGTGTSGEGLMLGEGEIPIIDILRKIDVLTSCNCGNSANKAERIVQGTVELLSGHLHKAKLQRMGLEWLLLNGRDIFY